MSYGTSAAAKRSAVRSRGALPSDRPSSHPNGRERAPSIRSRHRVGSSHRASGPNAESCRRHHAVGITARRHPPRRCDSSGAALRPVSLGTAGRRPLGRRRRAMRADPRTRRAKPRDPAMAADLPNGGTAIFRQGTPGRSYCSRPGQGRHDLARPCTPATDHSTTVRKGSAAAAALSPTPALSQTAPARSARRCRCHSNTRPALNKHSCDHGVRSTSCEHQTTLSTEADEASLSALRGIVPILDVRSIRVVLDV